MDLKEYLRAARGLQTAVARAVGCPSQLIWQWQAGVRPVPADRCGAIEVATQGSVTCEELRPDLAWHRVTDADWPWHPQGRPLIDMTRQPAPLAPEVRDAA